MPKAVIECILTRLYTSYNMHNLLRFQNECKIMFLCLKLQNDGFNINYKY